MSGTDATFAVAQALEKVAKAIDAHRESVDQLIMSVNFQRANTVPTTGTPPPPNASKATGLTLKTCNRCGAPLKMKDGKIDWKKGPQLGVFIPMNPDGTEHRCQTGGGKA